MARRLSRGDSLDDTEVAAVRELVSVVEELAAIVDRFEAPELDAPLRQRIRDLASLAAEMKKLLR